MLLSHPLLTVFLAKHALCWQCVTMNPTSTQWHREWHGRGWHCPATGAVPDPWPGSKGLTTL